MESKTIKREQGKSINWLKLSRKYHKWLMIIVGIQFLIWSISGVYMVSTDIHFIHGEHMTKNDQQTIKIQSVSYGFSDVLEDYPNASNITLSRSMDKAVYIFTNGKSGKVVIDAKTGEQISKITEANAIAIAGYYYAKPVPVKQVTLMTSREQMPAELSPRHLPFWQVTFEGLATPTFYISETTGQVVTKRHDFWRLFDWMWRFHIMDYDDGENVANWFLFVVALLGVIAALTGAVLTVYHIFLSKGVFRLRREPKQ